MDLSLADAATVLGRSPRQLRYLLRTGRIKARKIGTRWVISSADLPLTDAQRQGLAERAAAVRQAVDQALSPVDKAIRGTVLIPEGPPAGKKKHYSVRDLEPFRQGEEVYRAIVAALGREDEAARHLFGALDRITRGCHAYEPRDKCRELSAARESIASAVTCLLIGAESEDPRRSEFADRLERDVIPRLSRLLAAHERRSRRHRFESFGSRFSREDR
jgi:hypothetical protein